MNCESDAKQDKHNAARQVDTFKHYSHTRQGESKKATQNNFKV